jgi:hypothetical protein
MELTHPLITHKRVIDVEPARCHDVLDPLNQIVTIRTGDLENDLLTNRLPVGFRVGEEQIKFQPHRSIHRGSGRKRSNPRRKLRDLTRVGGISVRPKLATTSGPTPRLRGYRHRRTL